MQKTGHFYLFNDEQTLTDVICRWRCYGVFTNIYM